MQSISTTYGLISSTGEPSSASNPVTVMMLSDISSILPIESAIGFGLDGDLMVKTGLGLSQSGRLEKRESRSALFIQYKTQMCDIPSMVPRPGAYLG